ncbi:hypothetical protein LWI29_002912 [Acer saccharum]|uniref:Uncharacterized protein n=1 Tax=Acer saccharum TaxID=4024 RepID=A0AA39RGR0_ACESA|nr:hypothetical protein LWI29_002912 [Acer saccharum]
MINQDADDCETSSAGQSWVNPLQLLNTIGVERQQSYKGLMYVNIEVNGRAIQAMLDTGATNNFVAQREVDRLGLNLLESTSRIKTVNSRAMPVRGVAETTLKVGSWQDKCSLMVVPLDDFDLILGVEFFVEAKAMLMPYLRGILIGDKESPCFVQAYWGTQDIKQGERQKDYYLY